MSNSRSLTPTPNRPGPTTAAATLDTEDRPETQTLSGNLNKARNIEETPHPLMRSFVHDPALQSPILRGVTRSAGGELTPPKTKRLRISSIGSPKQAPAPESPSSDSQGGMADSEGDGTPGRGEDVPSSTGPQPKKKRTRTLTTPHQAAVLHALLEKSRFPTTAVREEVGRSIGLSARKVQIWFQNQRQKARKSSQSRGLASKSHPPQYGPYPPVASPVDSASYPGLAAPHAHGSYTFHPTSSTPLGVPGSSTGAPRNQSVPPVDVVHESNDAPRLSGPGMPGALLYPRRLTRTRDDEWPASAPPLQQRFPTSTRLARYHSPPPSDGYSTARSITSRPRPRFERDPSRTLPPLVRTRPSTTSSLAMRGPLHWDETPHPSRASGERVTRSISPEIRFAHQALEHQGYSPTILPPPFVLQPAPQWDESADAILSRPSSSWSHREPRVADEPPSSPSSSTKQLGLPPMTGALHSLRHEVGGGEMSRIQATPPTPQTHSPPPSHPSRYDPIREAFVPISRPLTPASRSPSQNRQEEGSPELPDVKS